MKSRSVSALKMAIYTRSCSSATGAQTVSILAGAGARTILSACRSQNRAGADRIVRAPCRWSWMALGLAHLLLFINPAHAAVPDLVAKMPVENTVELAAINAELIRLGPAGVVGLCKMLVPLGAGNDVKARFALSGLVKHANRPGADAERQWVSGALVEALATVAGDEVKAFLISQVQFVGRDEAVETLRRFLTDKQLAEPATQALLAIHTPAATTALAKALPSAEDAIRVTIIKALGELRCAEAAKSIAEFAASDDRDTRLAAWFALANMGDSSAAAILRQATAAKSAYERTQALSFYLLFARRLAEAGKLEPAESICRELVQSRTAPGEASVRTAALSTLVAIAGEGALPDLLVAADSEARAFRAGALNLGARLPGSAVTQKWVDKMNNASHTTRIEIGAMLARRGDPSALPGLLAALKDANPAVRLAAIDAACRLGRHDAVRPLLAFCETDRAAEIKAVQEALKRLPGERVLAEVAETLPKASPLGRRALLELLADRHAQAHSATILALVQDPDPSVRLAAIRALGNVARDNDLPQAIDLLVQTNDSAERAAAQQAVVEIAGRMDDPDQRATPVLAVMNQTTGDKKCALLKVLASLGGSKALQAVVAESRSRDAAVKDSALRALADWPDPSAVPALIAVLKSQGEAIYQVLATRGCLRLVDESEWAPPEKLAAYKQALIAAQRPEEKKLVLAALGQIRTLDSLLLVSACLDDLPLQAEAAVTAARIACPEEGKNNGLTGPQVSAMLKAVLEVCQDAKVRQKVETYLKTLTPAAAKP